VVDEGGDPIQSAFVVHDGQQERVDGRGEVHLKKLDSPLAMVVSAPGYLSEPLAIGATDMGSTVEIALLDDADGRRTVLHVTGDVMVGRRYQEPTEGSPLVPVGDDGSAARAVVSDAAPFLSLADLSMVNLETVIGDAGEEHAYPGKRYLLQTPPSALAALDELGVDAAIMANNHQRDWLDDGVAGSVAAVDAIGLPHVGTGISEETAGEGQILTTTNGTRVGVLAWTSVDGDYVNDAYPPDYTAQPADVAPEDLWQWETQSWGAPELGIPVDDRRIGGAWAAITAIEPTLDPDDVAALWSSAIAVYPQLQDWVARRGHGGAARWNSVTSVQAIQAMRPLVDVLVVDMHMGYQFAAVPGSGSRAAARAAVDAGADLVVAHHPHVLQGLEWYHGHLIAYSLGNFVFDQDFLSTFRTAFLRTVWEDGQLVQARLVPMFIDGYRPVPVADELADDTLRTLWDGSLLPATADNGVDLGVRAVYDPSIQQDLSLRLEHHTAVVEPGLPQTVTETVRLPCDGVVDIPPRQLTSQPIDGVGQLLVGRVLDGLGSFEDMDANEPTPHPTGWTWKSSAVTVDGGVFGRDHALQFVRTSLDQDRVTARMVARVPLPEHRLFADAEGAVALDGEASYSVRVRVDRVEDAATGYVRLELYHFDDLNPTEDPESTPLGEVSLPFTAQHGIHDLWLDLPASALDPIGGLAPNAALVYVSLDPPAHGETALRLWDLAVVEWRPASDQAGYGAIDFLRDGGGACGKIEIQALPLERD
jgi:poly-gamma-glutamate capsule biosynthesis protein CapA/YwtB (metallophosphatase superfamily)